MSGANGSTGHSWKLYYYNRRELRQLPHPDTIWRYADVVEPMGDAISMSLAKRLENGLIKRVEGAEDWWTVDEDVFRRVEESVGIDLEGTPAATQSTLDVGVNIGDSTDSTHVKDIQGTTKGLRQYWQVSLTGEDAEDCVRDMRMHRELQPHRAAQASIDSQPMYVEAQQDDAQSTLTDWIRVAAEVPSVSESRLLTPCGNVYSETD